MWFLYVLYPYFTVYCILAIHLLSFLSVQMLVEYGGKLQEHALAQIQAWKDMLHFYKQNF